MKKPFGVKIVGWYLIISGMLSFLSAITYFEELRSVSAVTLYLGMIQSIIVFISGIALIRKKSWGKLLYLLSTPIFIITFVVLTGVAPIMNIIAYIFIFFVLTRSFKE